MINRYDCLNCGWYADINPKDNKYFSTEICPMCRNKLKNIGSVNKI